MTAATSSETTKQVKTKSFFGRRFFTDINSNKKCLIVNCVMQLLALPVAAVLVLLMCYVEENYDNLSPDTINSISNGGAAFAVIAVIAFGISIITAIPTVLNHFSYLHKKSNADMHYALPLNNKQRFFADYLSGLAVYLVPVIAAVILSLAIVGIGSIFIDTKMFWEKVMPIVFRVGTIVFLGMLQFYTVSVFSLTFCGNGFEAGFSICAFNVLIPSTIACLWFAVIETAAFGVVPESLLRMNIFTDTSPVGAAAFLLNFDDYFSAYGDSTNFDSMFAKWIIMNIICTAIYAAAAFFLYKSRKAEDVSKPYVHRSFFYALLTMAVFCILSMFITEDAPISAGIVVCAIGWFIMEIVTRRGFKKLWTAAISFVVATAAALGVLGICIASDGFGATKRIPSADSVRSVIIDSGSSQLISSVKFTDEKVIEEAVKLHQECIDKYYNPDKNDFPPVNKGDNIYTTNDSFFRLTYTTKSGAVFSREYMVTQSMETGLIKAILLSDEAADLFTEDIGYKDEYSNSRSPYVMSASFINLSQSANLSESEMEKFVSDLKADINDMTEDDLMNGDVYCYLDNTMFVLKSFERTIANFNDLGFDFSEASIDENFSIMTDPVLASYNGLSYETYGENDYSYDIDFLSAIDELCNISSYGYSGSISYGRVSEISCDNPYISDLIDNMTSFVIGEKPIAIISLSDYGSYHFLKDTEENRKLIDDLMKYKIEDHDYDPYAEDTEEIFYQ